LATAIVTLLIVGGLLVFAGGSPAAKGVAVGVLVVGALQWLGLGMMGKRFSPPE